MLTISLLVNVIIVFPISYGMLSRQPGMDDVFGPTSAARRILASVYLAIGLVSIVGLAGLALGQSQYVVPMAAGLLVMQVTYKLITVATVGLASAVVLTNIAVIVIHTVTLAVLARIFRAIA